MSQVRLDENTVAPGTPSSGKSIIYPKTDGLWYSKDDAGVETPLGGGGGIPTIQNTTATGTQDNFDLDDNYTFLHCLNANALTFSGFTVKGATPSNGDTLIIHSEGTSTVKVENEGSGSTAVNRVDTPSNSGQIVGEDGTIVLIYNSDRWHQISVEPGSWILVPYSSGNFTASESMTWTVDSGDQATFVYRQMGVVIQVLIFIVDSTVGGTLSSTLLVQVPGGFSLSSSRESPTIGIIVDAGTQALGSFARSDNTHFGATKADGANWSASTNQTRIFFGGFFGIS